QLDLGESPRPPAALERALRLLDRGLKQAGLDAVERRAFLDQVAFLEQDLFEITRHPRPHLDAIDRLDASDEVERLRDRLLLRLDGPGRPRRPGLVLAAMGRTPGRGRKSPE